MLHLYIGKEIFGSYIDLEIEMRLNNLDTIEIVKTQYCFVQVEGYRKLSYKDIKKLAELNELEKIKYQSMLKKMYKN